jgi:protein SCO1
VRRSLLGAFAATLVATATPTGATEPDYRKAIEFSQRAIGRTIGDYRLRDPAGKPVSLADLRGKPLVVSFIYTGCFQACPVTTEFLARSVRLARDALGDDSFRVVSIGFNQPFDDPVSMGRFGRQARISDRNWLFLSPDPKDVAALTGELGFAYEPTPKGFDHIAQATLIGADGVVYRQIYGESFELQMLVGPLKELISGQTSDRSPLEDLWIKVKLYCTVYDPYSGGYRVNYSLFFELFAGLSFLGAVGWWLVRERMRIRRGT